MRIGIFGGSFNPPHFGHKTIADKVMKAADLQKIIIIPASVPPHKQNTCLVSSQDRMAMCRLLFSQQCYEISDIEINRPGKSYTYDTLCQLRELYPDDELYLIIGSDMLLSFHKWYKYERILSMVRLAVATREERVDISELKKYGKEILKRDESKGEIVFADYKPFECSSTDIRERISQGVSTKGLIPPELDCYIKNHLLYDSPFPEYRNILRQRLDDYRFIHSVNVAESAKELAERYSADADKAYFAGLVHDIMKNASEAEQLQIMEKGGIILSRTEKNNPKLWHAIAGECLLRCELSVKDSDILNSVRYHTTGRAGMSLLEKVIYVADYISAERSYPDVEVMRELAHSHSLEKASLYSLQYTLKTLSEKKGIIHENSLDFYNELIINERSQNNDRA